MNLQEEFGFVLSNLVCEERKEGEGELERDRVRKE